RAVDAESVGARAVLEGEGVGGVAGKEEITRVREGRVPPQRATPTDDHMAVDVEGIPPQTEPFYPGVSNAWSIDTLPEYSSLRVRTKCKCRRRRRAVGEEEAPRHVDRPEALIAPGRGPDRESAAIGEEPEHDAVGAVHESEPRGPC